MKKLIIPVSTVLVIVLSLTILQQSSFISGRHSSIRSLPLITADMAPALLVKLLPGDTSSVPLGINDVDIDIQVTGNIAVTTMTLNFYNDQNRNLEGQFVFPLAAGQSIHYFAMDVNGKLSEAAVVDKQKGREVFESVERRRVDPGLLEWTSGNNFSARIFPIPSKGYKKIIVGFQQELSADDKSFIYDLPLAFKSRLKHFGITASVDGTAAQPLPLDDNAYMLSFSKPGSDWQAQVSYKNIIADHAVQFTVPINPEAATVYLEKIPGDGDRYYFYTLVHNTVKPTGRKSPAKLGILWDVSGSAAGRDINKELDIISKYLAKLQNVQVQIIPFSIAILTGGISLSPGAMH